MPSTGRTLRTNIMFGDLMNAKLLKHIKKKHLFFFLNKNM